MSTLYRTNNYYSGFRMSQRDVVRIIIIPDGPYTRVGQDEFGILESGINFYFQVSVLHRHHAGFYLHTHTHRHIKPPPDL